MISNQTLEILKSLDKKELKRFGVFLKSPYFNTSQPIIKIFLIAQKAYPHFKDEVFDFQKVFTKLYPNEKYTETRIKNLYADFGNLLKKFIGYEQMASDNEDLDAKISQGLTQKNLNRISNKVIEKSLKENDDELLSIPDRFHYLYRLNVNYIHNLGFLQEHGSSKYIESDIALTEKLTIFFLSNLLQISFFDSMNHKVFPMGENSFLKMVRDSLDIEKIIKYMKETNHPYASFLRILYLFFYYTENNITPAEYKELKEEIYKTIYNARKTDQTQFISRIVQIIYTKLIPSDRKYLNDVLDFAKLLQELKIYPDDNVQAFSSGLLRDIFVTAMLLKEYDWAENFVNEFSEYLNKDQKANSMNYFNGVLCFKRGKFEESLDYLNKVKTIEVVEKIGIRFYYMMNYIELKAYESALAALNSIRQFYHESKLIPDIFKVNVETSLKYFHEIVRCEEKGEKIDPYIYEEAKNAKRYIQAQYILEKMEKLK